MHHLTSLLSLGTSIYSLSIILNRPAPFVPISMQMWSLILQRIFFFTHIQASPKQGSLISTSWVALICKHLREGEVVFQNLGGMGICLFSVFSIKTQKRHFQWKYPQNHFSKPGNRESLGRTPTPCLLLTPLYLPTPSHPF